MNSKRQIKPDSGESRPTKRVKAAGKNHGVRLGKTKGTS